MTPKKPRVLVVFDNRNGELYNINQLASAVADGVRSVPDTACSLCPIHRTRPDVLASADGLIIGSPNFSGVTGAMKSWFDEAGEIWERGGLAGIPSGAFATGWSRSGTEATLMQLLHLLVANGCLFVPLPWTELMRTSGSYYGATAHGDVTEDDLEQARNLGMRVARFTRALASL